jgi:hypothetical protein
VKPYMTYVIRFGIWIHDPETGRSYAYDLRAPQQFQGVITGKDADDFRSEIDAEGDRMMAGSDDE